MLPTIASLVTIIIIIIAEILLEADGTTVTIKAYCKYDENDGLIPVTAQAKEHIGTFEKLGYKQVQQQKLDGIFCAFTLVNVEDEKDEELEQQLNTYHSAKKEMDTSKKYSEGWSDMDPCSTAGIHGPNEIKDNEMESQREYKDKSKKFLEAGIALDNYMQQKVQKKNTEKVEGKRKEEEEKKEEKKDEEEKKEEKKKQGEKKEEKKKQGEKKEEKKKQGEKKEEKKKQGEKKEEKKEG